MTRAPTGEPPVALPLLDDTCFCGLAFSQHTEATGHSPIAASVFEETPVADVPLGHGELKLLDGFQRWKRGDLNTEEFEGLFHELLHQHCSAHAPTNDVPVVVTREPWDVAWEREYPTWAERAASGDTEAALRRDGFRRGYYEACRTEASAYTRGVIEGRRLALAAMGGHVRAEVLVLKTELENSK